jgi:pyruvate/2-oxoglutarate dehydrogenase complex dihydrolipoamide acyltransferase (E2) component
VGAQLWVVRAGREATFVDEWRQDGAVAVNFDEFEAGDLVAVGETALLAKVGNPAQRTYASQLSSFAFKIEVGDMVVVPQLPKRRTYLVGEVIGGYEHVSPYSPSGPHRRRVQWLGEFDREALSREAVNTLGAIQTVFRPSKVEAELRNLLTALQPWTAAGSASAQPAAQAAASTGPAAPPSAQRAAAQPTAVAAARSVTAPAEVALQLDVRLGARGRVTITCDHPALVMQQVPRHVDPDSDWRDVPGIYVLTGTELQQTTTRTGAERTLTMTSIVRPWAYVGLSEKFFDRMNSHRQAKEEWRRALLVRSGANPFSGDDIKYLEARVYTALRETEEVALAQAVPHGNTSAQPRNPTFLDQCADAVVAVLRMTGTLI